MTSFEPIGQNLNVATFIPPCKDVDGGRDKPGHDGI
jgi:hypothetical protein